MEESQDLMQPTVSSKREANDFALFINISAYSGFGFKRFAFPKLQNIINPRSWVVVLNCSLFKSCKIRSISVSNTGDFTASSKTTSFQDKNRYTTILNYWLPICLCPHSKFWIFIFRQPFHHITILTNSSIKGVVNLLF